MGMATFSFITSVTGFDPHTLFQQFLALLLGVPGLYKVDLFEKAQWRARLSEAFAANMVVDPFNWAG